MKKLKNILILFLILYSHSGFCQEKLHDFQLTPKEKEILISKGRLVRESRKYFNWDNQLCEGVVELVKVKGKIEFNYIGPWNHYYKDGTIKDIYIFDDKGYLKKYDSYEKDGFNSYSCTYDFKTVDGTNYRIEHIKIFYLSGGLREEGFRYNKIETVNGVIKRNSPRHVGIRNFYNEDGELIKQKIKREKLAKKLEIKIN